MIYKRIKSKIWTLFLFIVILSGCKNMESEKYNNKNLVEMVGTTISMYMDEDVIENDFTYRVKSSKLKPEIFIENRYKKQMQYRILFLLNYEPVEFLYQGERVNFLDVDIDEGHSKQFSVEIPNIKEGLNDFIFLSIREPNYYLDKAKYIPPSSIYLHQRVVVISGDENKVNNKVTYNNITANQNSDKLNLIFVTEVPQNNYGEVVTLLNDENNERWLNFYSEIDNQTFALLIFLNEHLHYKQFIKVNSKGMVNYPISLPKIGDLKKNVTIMLVENPFKALVSEDNEDDVFKNREIRYTNRITIK